MEHREQSTIEAINVLCKDYPYAASLLIYAFIEQELKFWLLSNRKKLRPSRANLNIKIKKTQLCKLLYLSDYQFTRQCLNRCTLSKMEQILRIKSHEISKRRNNLMHLNRYIIHQHKLGKSQRSQVDEKALTKALDDLLFCSKRFFDPKLALLDGKLFFQETNKSTHLTARTVPLRAWA
jgi:hypothetical protein